MQRYFFITAPHVPFAARPSGSVVINTLHVWVWCDCLLEQHISTHMHICQIPTSVFLTHTHTHTGGGWFSKQRCGRVLRWQKGRWDRFHRARQPRDAIGPQTGSRARTRPPDWEESTTRRRRKIRNTHFTWEIFLLVGKLLCICVSDMR